MNFCDSFWILTRALKRRSCIINLCAFYLSCSTGSLVVWTRWTHCRTQDGNLGVQPDCIFGIFWIVCFHKKSRQVLLMYSGNQKNFVQENVKNCTLISHFASASGGLRSPGPLPGFAPDHTGGRKSPLGDGSPPDNLAIRPFYTIPDPPLCTPPLWNTGYADGETHPNYHPLGALGCGTSRRTGVMWGDPILDIIRHVICTKYCHNFLLKRHQCRHNCCHHKPYFTLICTKSSIGFSALQISLGKLTTLPRPTSWNIQGNPKK